MSNVGTAFVQILPQATGFAAALSTQMNTATQSVSQRLRATGATLTRSLSIPLLAVGAAAVAVAVQFDDSMRRIQALVGLGADEIGRMREAVLSLSGETAIAPAELADALFFITSSGFRGAEAMQLLEFSAKAAAAGLGSTQDIARAAAQSVQAYGAENLTGAEAVDTFVAAVREGNFEASELASSLGQVTPAASQAGIQLDELTGTIAFLTRSGGTFGDRVTQVNALITQLSQLTPEARAKLDELGVSSQDLSRVLAEDGIVPALELVEEALRGTDVTWREVLGSEEAMRAALGLLSGDASALQDVLEGTADAAGSTDAAFETVAEGSGFTLRQALNNIRLAGIEMGDALGPVAAQLADNIGNAAKEFSNLSLGMQEAVIGGLAFLIILGPLLTILGSVGQAIALVGAALGIGFGGAAILLGGFLLNMIAIELIMRRFGETTGGIIAGVLFPFTAGIHGAIGNIGKMSSVSAAFGQVWDGVGPKVTNRLGQIEGGSKSVWSGITRFVGVNFGTLFANLGSTGMKLKALTNPANVARWAISGLGKISFGPLLGNLGDILGNLRNIDDGARAAAGAIQNLLGLGSAAKSALGAFPKASGGPLAAGVPYMTGEEGRELFIPAVSGMLLPNPVTERLMGASAGGGAQVHHHHVYLGSREIAHVVDTIRRFEKGHR